MQCVFGLNSSGDFEVTDEVEKCFKEHGYFFVRGLLDAEELKLLRECVEQDKELQDSAYKRQDGHGLIAKLSLWDHPMDDITGAIARCEKVAGTFTKLMGDEIYHYHSKLNQKDAKTGGSFNWHQDYGYWYHNGCIFPDMATVFIPIDDTDIENGCLKIVPKSHQCGRIEHQQLAGQAGADVERVNHIVDKFGLLECEMKAGDGLFFHCNILHRSEQNLSDRRRWAYLISYNTKTNNPVKLHHHPFYTPMPIIPNSEVKMFGSKVCQKTRAVTDQSFMIEQAEENEKDEK